MKINKKGVLLTLVALTIGIVVSIPHILGILTFKSSYSPLTTNENLTYMEEETYIYAARVHQLLKGKIIGDAYIWEYARSPSPFLSEVGAIIPLAFIAILANSVPAAFLVADFVFPILLFLILMYIFKHNGFKFIFSITVSSAVILIPFLSSYAPYLWPFERLSGAENHPLFFSRTPYPQLTTVFLLLSILVITSFLRKPTALKLFFMSISLAASFYFLPFAGSTVLLGTIFLLPLIINKAKKVDKIHILITLGTLILLLIPWFVNQLELTSLLDEDFILRTTFKHQFLFPVQVRYVLIALILIFFARKKILSKIIAFYILATALLIDGHQLVIGRNLEADHWISRVLAPLGTLAIFIFLGAFLNRLYIKKRNIILVIILLSIISMAALKQFSWFDSNRMHLEQPSSIQSLISQIEQNTEKNDIIASRSREANKFIPGLTGRWIFLAQGNKTVVSSTEQINRICFLGKEKKLSVKKEELEELQIFIAGLKQNRNSKINFKYESIDEMCKDNEFHLNNFQIDFLVDKDSSGNWYLFKL